LDTKKSKNKGVIHYGFQKNVSSSLEKFLKTQKKELYSSSNTISLDSITNKISNEFSNKYKQIYSIYQNSTHLELTSSFDKSELQFPLNSIISSTYSYKDLFKINFIWDCSLSGNTISLTYTIIPKIEDLRWNFKRHEELSPPKFPSISLLPTLKNINWNDDYCLDILDKDENLITIWISLRNYDLIP
jgi:hypothetical protein